jgi:hypothetical protein
MFLESLENNVHLLTDITMRIIFIIPYMLKFSSSLVSHVSINNENQF